MAYIGKTPVIGNFQKCDAITVVNGQAAYTMQVGGTNVSPESENHMLVSLNGILQAPVDSFTISGSTITFASNLATGDVIDFIMLLGNVLDLGVPSDNTVSTAKIVDGAITSAKLASGVGGKVLQVVQTLKSDIFSTTSTSYTDVTGLSVNITPTSTSNKVLILASVQSSASSTSADNFIKLLRGTTDLREMLVRTSTATAELREDSVVYLDSPSSTSQQTYKFQMKVESGTAYINRRASSTPPVFDSIILVMEISA